MDPIHKEALQSCHKYLLENIDVVPLLDELYSKTLFIQDDRERIENLQTPSEKRRLFLSMLPHKGPNLWDCFLDALKDNDKQYICQELHKRVVCCRISQHVKSGYEFQPNNVVAVEIDKFVNDAPSLQLTEHDKNIISNLLRIKLEHKDVHVIQDDEHEENFRSIHIRNIGTCSNTPNHSGTTGANNLPIQQQKTMKDWTEEDVITWLKSIQIKDKHIDSIQSQEINGSVLFGMPKEDTVEAFPGVPYGPRCTIIEQRDKVKEEQKSIDFSKIENKGLVANDVDSTTLTSRTKQLHNATQLEPDILKEKQLVQKVDNTNKFSYEVNCVVHDLKLVPSSNFLEPFHSLSLTDLSKKENWDKFAMDIITFVCACLNERHDATIHFGISPWTHGSTKRGQIVGTMLCGEKQEYEDFLQTTFVTRFYPDQLDNVRSCCSKLKFVDIENKENKPLYVVELDVTPSYSLCGNDIFYVRENAEGDKESECMIYRCPDGDVKRCNGEEKKIFIGIKDKLAEKRQKQERDTKYVDEDERLKIKDNLCNGEVKLLDGVHYVLVITKPDAFMDEQFIKDSLSFLPNFPWTVVFDFDDSGMIQRLLIDEYNFSMDIIADIGIFEENPTIKDSIKASANCAWIHVNGLEGGKDALSEIDWTRHRRKPFEEAIRFYSSEFPQNRAKIVTLVLSKLDNTTKEGSLYIVSEFQDSHVIFAQNEAYSAPLTNEIKNRLYMDENTLKECSVIGIPWGHVNSILSELTPLEPTRNECIMPASTGAYVSLDNNRRTEWKDLEILSCKECENVSDDPNELQSLSQQHEIRFYRGEDVSWWNFYFELHVLKRDIYDDVSKNVKQLLERKTSQEGMDGCTVSVFLYHQPGAGGTTVARNILWELRKMYRCAIVKNVTEVHDTASQILQLRSHFDTENPRPVLLLLDNIEDDKLGLLMGVIEERAKQMIRHKHDPYRKNVIPLVCVFLVCIRNASPSHKKNMRRNRHFLKHYLSPKELTWFNKKNKELEERRASEVVKQPQNMISFNIMKANFKKSFIKKMTRELVNGVTSDKERKLLKYVTLLNRYDPAFRSIPTATFDGLMVPFGWTSSIRRGKKAILSRWESNLSDMLRILINEKCGHGKPMTYISTMRLINELLADEVLQIFKDEDNKTLSQLFIEFLSSSEVIVSKSYTKGNLHVLIKDIMKKRFRMENGKLNPFSQAIIDIKTEESVEKAADVLNKAFELTDDPFIAQQIARLYMEAENWIEAEKYVQMAQELYPNNSFLLDSYGRLHLKQINQIYAENLNANQQISADQAKKVLELSMKAVNIFEREQRLTLEEVHVSTQAENRAGVFGELETIQKLILCFQSFGGSDDDPEELNRLMGDENYIPKFIEDLFEDEDQEIFVRTLSGRIQTGIIQLEDERWQIKEIIRTDYQKGASDDNMDRLRNVEKLTTFFGPYSKKVGTETERDKCQSRRSNIKGIAGLSQSNYKTLGEKQLLRIIDMATENLKSTDARDPWDIQTLITSKLALIHLNPKYISSDGMCVEQIAVSLTEMVELSIELFEKRNTYTSFKEKCFLEPYLYFVMFNFPREEQSTTNINQKQIVDAIKEWREKYHEKYPNQNNKDNITENKEAKPYFFGNGKGLEGIVSYEKLKQMNHDMMMIDDSFWRNTLLKRFQGTLSDDGKEVNVHVSTGGNKYKIRISASFPIRRRSMFNKTVFFVIGMSWKGPKAFDITPFHPLRNPTSGMPCEATPPRNAIGQDSPRSSQGQSSASISQVKSEREKLDEINAKLRKIEEIKVIKRKKKKSEKNLLKEERSLRKEKDQIIRELTHVDY